MISTHLFPQGYLNGLFLMNSLGYRNFDLFVRTNSLMSLQFKKRKRSSNLRKSDDVSSEDDVTVVTNEAKKVKTVRVDFYCNL